MRGSDVSQSDAPTTGSGQIELSDPAAPVLTANDFQCFLNLYAAGCSAP